MDISMETAAALTENMAEKLKKGIEHAGAKEPTAFVGIPRGGIPVALMMANAWHNLINYALPVFSSDEDIPPPCNERPVLVDDVCMTGNTLASVQQQMGPIYIARVVLIHKGLASGVLSGMEVPSDEWVTFPWEVKEQGGIPLDAVTRLIEYVGDDPKRPGLVDTPARVLRFLDELRLFRSFDATAFESKVTDLQVTSNIPFGSLCEHHMLPYTGVAAIGYIPNGKLLGLSKTARCVRMYAGGLTMQENLAREVAEKVSEMTGSKDVAVVITATHTCMTMRGIQATGASTTSSAMLGKFRDAPALRAEFMALARVG